MTLKLVYPTLALILWIFIVGVILMLRRKDAFSSGAVRPEDVNVSTERYPVPARLASAAAPALARSLRPGQSRFNETGHLRGRGP